MPKNPSCAHIYRICGVTVINPDLSIKYCVRSSICLPMCAQRFACVHVCYCGWGQPELSSLMCLGGPGDSRALKGVDVSAQRDL